MCIFQIKCLTVPDRNTLQCKNILVGALRWTNDVRRHVYVFKSTLTYICAETYWPTSYTDADYISVRFNVAYVGGNVALDELTSVFVFLRAWLCVGEAMSYYINNQLFAFRK